MPPPALPGSGSTVGGRSPPSQPMCPAPVACTPIVPGRLCQDCCGDHRLRPTRAPGPRAPLLRDRRRQRRAGVLRAALAGGVDMVQLRDPALSDDELLAAAARFRALCDEHGALLWINDRPDLALRRRRRRRARGPGRHAGRRGARARSAPSCSSACPPTRPSSSTAGIAGGRRPAQRGPGVGDAHQAGPPGRGARVRAPRGGAPARRALVRHRRHRRAATWPRWSTRAPSASWWCARSATRPTRAPPPPSCGPRSDGGPLAQRSSRKRRKQRQRARGGEAPRAQTPRPRPADGARGRGWRAATRAGARRTRPRGRR